MAEVVTFKRKREQDLDDLVEAMHEKLNHLIASHPKAEGRTQYQRGYVDLAVYLIGMIEENAIAEHKANQPEGCSGNQKVLQLGVEPKGST